MRGLHLLNLPGDDDGQAGRDYDRDRGHDCDRGYGYVYDYARAVPLRIL